METTHAPITASMNDLQVRVLQLKAHGFDIYQELNVLNDRVKSLNNEQNATIAELQKVLELVKGKQEQEQAELAAKENLNSNPLDGKEPDEDTGTILLDEDPNAPAASEPSDPVPSQPQPSTVGVQKKESEPEPVKAVAPKAPAKPKKTNKKTAKKTVRKPKTAHSMGEKSK